MKRIRSEQQAVIRLALVAAFAEAAYAVINALALPVFVTRELQETLHLGLIVGAFLLAEALLKGPMGVISDRLGRRVILVIAPLASALAAVALTLVHPPSSTPKLVYMLAVRGLDGAAAAGLWTTMYAAVADQVPEERRASAMSTLTVSYLVGFAVGPALGGWAEKHYSIRAPFYLVAGLFLLASITAFLLAPRQSPHGASHPEQSEGVNLAGFIESLRAAPQFILIALVVFLAIGFLIPTAPLIALDQFHLDTEEYGRLFVVPAVVIGVLSVPLGKLSDFWGPSRSVQIGMMTAAGSLWALALLPKSEPVLVIGASLLGLGFVVGLPAWMAIISSISDPQHRGAMIGTVATAQGIGAFLGVVTGPMLYKEGVWLAASLNWLWPGKRLPTTLLPVIGAGILLSVAWIASLALVRDPSPDRAEA
jgi:DHA1 family tetracycline resistance protein-like MFS transporter